MAVSKVAWATLWRFVYVRSLMLRPLCLTFTRGMTTWNLIRKTSASHMLCAADEYAMSHAVLGKNVCTWVDSCPCLHAASTHSGCD